MTNYARMYRLAGIFEQGAARVDKGAFGLLLRERGPATPLGLVLGRRA